MSLQPGAIAASRTDDGFASTAVALGFWALHYIQHIHFSVRAVSALSIDAHSQTAVLAFIMSVNTTTLERRRLQPQSAKPRMAMRIL